MLYGIQIVGIAGISEQIMTEFPLLIHRQNGGKLAQLKTFLEGRRVRLLVEALHRLGLYDW